MLAQSIEHASNPFLSRPRLQVRPCHWHLAISPSTLIRLICA